MPGVTAKASRVQATGPSARSIGPQRPALQPHRLVLRATRVLFTLRQTASCPLYQVQVRLTCLPKTTHADLAPNLYASPSRRGEPLPSAPGTFFLFYERQKDRHRTPSYWFTTTQMPATAKAGPS